VSPRGRKRAALAAALVVCGLALAGCTRADGGYAWGWYVLNPWHPKGSTNLKFLLTGLWATLAISSCAIALSVVLGMLLALAGLAKNAGLRAINRVYVEVFRAIPLLVLLLWVYYGLPVMLGIQFGVFVAGVLTLALSDSAFESEVFRAGIQSVPRGQLEAAETLGFSGWQKFRYIVAPQAIRTVLPALANQFIYVLKMSSLVSVVGFQELTRRANELNVTEYRPLEIYTFLVVEYLLLILVVSWLVRRLERRMAGAARA
jgi:His/Glu/Gln/Arg/opine family amino acid ABC transporter permease subunit